MNKFKHFVFIGAATALMLLVIGSWVTSTQATSTVIMEATLTPTSTPAITGTDIPGEIPSAEVQQELKDVVQSYVELRYRALNMLQ